MRRGWKSSSASIFSPVPSSLIGLPVTARIDSAAPPRPSPSTRVSTMPVMPTRSLKFLARLTASWPVRLSATSRISCGRAASLDLRHLGHQRLVDMGAAGRVEHHDVVALQPRRLSRRAGRSAPASGPATIGSVSTPTCRPSTASCSCAAGRLTSSEAISTRRFWRSVEALGDLGGGGGLAGALQADHHDGDGRPARRGRSARRLRRASRSARR